MGYEVEHTDAEWLELLGPERFRLMRQAGTEAPFAGCFVGSDKPGVYRCAACGNALFSSETKYESGSGWPSWYAPAGPGAIEEVADVSHDMTRTEVRCARCGSHLGHVFADGPPPTGKRH